MIYPPSVLISVSGSFPADPYLILDAFDRLPMLRLNSNVEFWREDVEQELFEDALVCAPRGFVRDDDSIVLGYDGPVTDGRQAWPSVKHAVFQYGSQTPIWLWACAPLDETGQYYCDFSVAVLTGVDATS